MYECPEFNLKGDKYDISIVASSGTMQRAGKVRPSDMQPRYISCDVCEVHQVNHEHYNCFLSKVANGQ